MAESTVNKIIKQAEGGRKPKSDDPIRARGVGLKESEWTEIEKIAANMDQNIHFVTVAFLRYGLEAYRAGKLKPKKETKQTF